MSVIHLQLGDWVRGKAAEGELIQGYVVTEPDLEGVTKVRVMQSDRVEIIGHEVNVPTYRLLTMDTIALYEKELMATLIDAALLAKDKEWFMELTSQLKSMESGQANSPIQHKHVPYSRI